MTKAKALLIAGFPNTGTTITAMIIGQHPAAFATGELAQLPEKRHFADLNICSCGGKVKDCAFWLDIRDRYLAGPRDDRRLYDLIATASRGGSGSSMSPTTWRGSRHWPPIRIWISC